MSTPILDIWTQSDDKKKTASLTLASKRLRANADAYMVDAAAEKIEAEAAYQKILADSQKAPDFAGIVAAQLRLKAADLTYDSATEVYVKLFGESPTV